MEALGSDERARRATDKSRSRESALGLTAAVGEAPLGLPQPQPLRASTSPLVALPQRTTTRSEPETVYRVRVRIGPAEAEADEPGTVLAQASPVALPLRDWSGERPLPDPVAPAGRPYRAPDQRPGWLLLAEAKRALGPRIGTRCRVSSSFPSRRRPSQDRPPGWSPEPVGALSRHLAKRGGARGGLRGSVGRRRSSCR
jgi:hypothetical protein